MNCEEVKSELAAYVYGEPTEHSEAIERHLAECAACARDAAELKAVVACLSERPDIAPEPRLGADWQAPARSRWRRWVGAAVAAAAAVLVLALVRAEVRCTDGAFTLRLALASAPSPEPAMSSALVREECLRQFSPALAGLVSMMDESQKRQEEQLLTLAQLIDRKTNSDFATLQAGIRQVKRDATQDIERTRSAVNSLAVAFLGAVESDADAPAALRN